MKNSIIPMLICSMSLVACGGGGGSDTPKQPKPPVEPPIDNNIVLAPNALIPFEFIDAKTKQKLNIDVALSVSDKDKGKLATANSSVNQTQKGSGFLVLDPELTQKASPQQPITLSVIASADGYFTTSTDVVYSGGDSKLISIALVSKAEPPAGTVVAVQKNVSTNEQGALQQKIELTAVQPVQGGQNNIQSKFVLDAGTTLKDHKGVPLKGDLQVSMGYFSPEAENIGDVFPGGLNPLAANVITSTGVQSQSGYFITAGLVAVDIVDSTGRKAHLFSENSQGTITIETPSTVINPETSQPIKAGDTVPVWSHDEVTGVWTQEGVGTYVKNSQGNLEVNYKVSHLSYWNLDWWGNTCSMVPVQFSKSFSSPTWLNMQVYVNGVRSYGGGSIKKSNEITGLYNVPNDQRVELRIVDQSTGQTVASGQKPVNNCSTVNIHVDANFNPKVRTVPVQILLTAPSGFTKDEVNLLLNEISGITAAQRSQILAFTHPNNATDLFVLDQAAYARLEQITQNKAQVQNLKTLMTAALNVSGYFYGADQDNNYYNGALSKTAIVSLDLPNKDITFRGQETYTTNYYNWWTGQYQPYSYTYTYGYLSGSLKNKQGRWEYFYIPLKKSAEIKATDTKGTIIFEDISALQRVMSYIKANQK